MNDTNRSLCCCYSKVGIARIKCPPMPCTHRDSITSQRTATHGKTTVRGRTPPKLPFQPLHPVAAHHRQPQAPCSLTADVRTCCVQTGRVSWPSHSVCMQLCWPALQPPPSPLATWCCPVPAPFPQPWPAGPRIPAVRPPGTAPPPPLPPPPRSPARRPTGHDPLESMFREARSADVDPARRRSMVR